MLSLLLEIHFWTLNDDIYISNNDFGAFKYHDKREFVKSSSYEKKKLFACGRNYQWTLSNKKPSKLRQALKELEENVESQRIVRLKWLREDVVVLFLNSGIIAYININLSSGDVVNISFDRVLRDKLLSLHISDILLTNIFSICCYNDPQLTLIYYSKPAFKKVHRKLSDLDPRFISVNLPGPSGRRLLRKLSLNKTGDVISVWWKYSDDDVFPWSPLVKDIDRANVHVYFVTSSKLELICYHRTEYDLLGVVFSSVESNMMYVVEQKISREGDISVENSTFEIVKCSRLQRSSVVSIPLQSQACCIEFSPDRNNLLLGCLDGSVVLYNLTRALTHIVRSVFVPAIIRWHVDGYMVAVASARGQIQCFDFALSCIKMQCISEDVTPTSVIDLSVYFTQSLKSQLPSLVEMEWNVKSPRHESCESSAEDSFLLLTFGSGPLVMLRVLSVAVMTPEILVTQYVYTDQIDKAINVLLAMDWDTTPSLCCSLLKRITNYIFTVPGSSPVEKYSQIQMALGSFYSPVRPISHSVETEFYKPVRNIFRRLFHYLLRYDLNDLALNIAIKLNEHDLFMDLYYYAKHTDNAALLATAWEKAEQILAEDSAANPSSDSENCDCSCSECSCESEENFGCEKTVKPEVAQQGPSSSIAISPSTRMSFAAVTRVNSARSLTSQSSSHNSGGYGNKTNDDVRFEQNVPRAASTIQKEIPNKMQSNDDILPIKKSTAIPPSVSKNIPNEITQQLLHQTGLPDNKILESKSIKVVHFGVV